MPTRSQQATVVVLTEAEIDKTGVELAQVINPGAAGGDEIAIISGIDAFAIFQVADQLGHQKIEVHITLTVRVTDHIDRHTHHRSGEVAAVVKIETAQEILVGLAVAGVLGDDHAGNGFQHFSRAQQGSISQLLGGDGAFAG